MAADSTGATKHRIGYRLNHQPQAMAENPMAVPTAVGRLATPAAYLGQQPSSVLTDGAARRPRHKRTPRCSQSTASPTAVPASGPANRTISAVLQPPANDPTPPPTHPSASTVPEAVGLRYGKPTATVHPRRYGSACDCDYCSLLVKREPSPAHSDDPDIYRDFLMHPVEIPYDYFLLNDVD